MVARKTKTPTRPKPDAEPSVDAKSKPRRVVITPPKFQRTTIKIQGASPYCQNRFSRKQQDQIEETQRAGTQARSRRKRAPKDFEALVEQAKHYSREGWVGIPASAFRNAMISACKLVGFKMTIAKCSIFIEADGYDREDATPLVRIHGKSVTDKAFVRNATGVVDLRWRPRWDDWWADLRIRWDTDQFDATDIVNLVARSGMQVGIGEGRADSPNSNGIGRGFYEVAA